MRYQELEPARAKAKSPDKLWDDPEWVAEEKLDGWRFLMHFGQGLERTFMTGRRTSTTTGLLSEKGLCAPMLWPGGDTGAWGYTVLDGEVMPPVGANFRDLAGIMNVAPAKAAERIAEIGPPRYFAFDVLFYGGEDAMELTWVERQHVLTRMIAELDHPLIKRVPARADKRAWYESIVDGGGEGVILKHQFATYGEGWVKVKRYSTLDVVVDGFTDAKFGRTGKFHGQIGAVIVSVYGSNGKLIEVGQVSGMTDDVRLDMTNNPERWLGKVIEVRAHGFAKERLREPRYKRARPDADPRHATLAKMFADLGIAPSTPGDPQQSFGF